MKIIFVLIALFFSFNVHARVVSTSIGLQNVFSDSYRSSTGYTAGIDVFPIEFLYLSFQYDAAQARVDSTHPDYSALNGKNVNNYNFGVGINNNYTINGHSASTSVGFYYSLVKSNGLSTNGFNCEIREDFFFYKELIGARLAFQYKYRKIPFNGGPSEWQNDFASSVSLLISY